MEIFCRMLPNAELAESGGSRHKRHHPIPEKCFWHPCPLFWHFYIILILWHSYFNFGDSAQCSDTHKILISDMFQLYWWLLPLYWATFQLSDTLFCFNRVLIYDWLLRQFHLSEAFHHLPDTLIIYLTLPSISGNTVYFLCRFRAIVHNDCQRISQIRRQSEK